MQKHFWRQCHWQCCHAKVCSIVKNRWFGPICTSMSMTDRTLYAWHHKDIFLFTCTNVESSIGVFQLKEAQNSAWNFVVGKKLATWSLEFEKACFDVLKNSVIILLIIQIRILKGWLIELFANFTNLAILTYIQVGNWKKVNQ